MSWNYDNLQNWITFGCPNASAEVVHTLDLSHNQLTSFACPQDGLTSLPDSIFLLKNLLTLDLSENKLTTLPDSISALTILRELNLSWNQLTSLAHPRCRLTSLARPQEGLTTLPDSISGLTNLEQLNLSGNQLTTLSNSISALKNLLTLDLSENRLTTLPDSISALTNLHWLNIGLNRLTTLPDFSTLINLYVLNVSGNRLTSLPDFSTLINLGELDISWNELTTLPPCLGNLPRLQYLDYSNNPIDYIPANVMRIINRIDTVQGVYKDSQSVHNSSIQKSLLDSVNRLLAIPIPQEKKKVIHSILEDSILSETTKARLVEYSEDTSIHTVLNLTFSEMLEVVWNRIGMLESKDEIKKTLNAEIHDAQCKCFTGKISRLVNCLAGYDDLVVVEIADKEQIGTVIEIVRNRLGESYTVEEHRRISILELTERGYSQEVIDEWVGYIE